MRTAKLKTKHIIISIVIMMMTATLLFFAHLRIKHAEQATNASERTPASEEKTLTRESKTHTYKIADGYGEYTGMGKSKIEASSMARKKCVIQKALAYEARHGVTPDPDTADLFIDACINK